MLPIVTGLGEVVRDRTGEFHALANPCVRLQVRLLWAGLMIGKTCGQTCHRPIVGIHSQDAVPQRVQIAVPGQVAQVPAEILAGLSVDFSEPCDGMQRLMKVVDEMHDP